MILCGHSKQASFMWLNSCFCPHFVNFVSRHWWTSNELLSMVTPRVCYVYLLVDFQPTTVDGDSTCVLCLSAGGLPTNYCRRWLHVCAMFICWWTSNQLLSMVTPRVCYVYLLVDFQPTTVDGDSTCVLCLSAGGLPTNYCRWWLHVCAMFICW